MNNLEKIRREKGISREWLSQQTGIHRNMIFRYEKRICEMPSDRLFLLAKILGVSVYKIMGEEEPTNAE